MSANKTWMQNEWDTNKQTLLDPDKGLYELQHAKEAVQAARDVTAEIDESMGELLAALEKIASCFGEYGYKMSSELDLAEIGYVARHAIAAHKARITTLAPLAQLWESESDE